MAHAQHKPQQDVFPASQYLQERLQERRARHTRPERSRQSDFGPQTASGRDDDIFISEGDSKRTPVRPYDSSPLAPVTSKHASAEESARKRAPGVRQLDDQIDRLNKENFDLKLELDHRRAQGRKLVLEIERMRESVQLAEDLQAEHKELLRINSDLVEELEKRDKAIGEAVNIIYELEERIEDLEDDHHSVTRASTIHADSGYAGTETQEQAPTASPADVVVKASKALSPGAATAASRDLNEILDSPSKPRRRPLFLSQDKPSTHALRTVYLENAKQLHPVKSFQSILSRHTSTIDEDEGGLSSPHFSNLSESSFPSLYSPKKISPDRHAWEPVEEASTTPLSLGSHTRQASISRVSQWIEGHDVLADTPSKKQTRKHAPRAASPPLTAISAHDDQYQSLNDALTTPLFEPLEMPFRPHTVQPSDSRRSSRTPTSFGGPIFGEPLLSPNSDAASQRLLRSSRSTIVGEKSINDSLPYNTKGFDALDVTLRTAPKQMRSSVELNTAFVSNLEYRKTGLSTVYHARQSTSPSSEEDERPSILKGEYFGYPDGNSILSGTPSRFLNHSKPSATQAYYDSSPSPEAARKPERQQSSAGAVRKPDFVRPGTSPSVPLALTTDLPGKGFRGELTSPMSYRSTSSSNRTVYGQHGSRPMSPEALSPAGKPVNRGIDRVSASPARATLTQKTQQLFRRLSSSHGSDRVPDVRERQISPSPSRPTLPTLTSTPSSAYVNVIPKEMRRANGSQGVESPKPTQQSALHTPVPIRTRTEPEVHTTTPSTDNATEKRGFFGRRGSFKAIAGLERAKTTTPNSSSRGRRRRSSVKDVLTPGRRGWA